METLPDEPLLRAKTFLEFDFSDRKAELDIGVIRMVPGATSWHCVVQGNLLALLHMRLRGTGYQASGLAWRC